VAQPLTETRSWSAESATVSDIDRAIRRQRAELGLLSRATVVNLIVWAQSEEAVDASVKAMARLGSHHPGRIVVLSCRPEAGAGIEATVEVIREVEPTGLTVGHEQVRLRISGPVCQHLDSVVGPLAVPDLPVAIWYPDTWPRADDPLTSIADAVLVDSRSADSGGRPVDEYIADLIELTRRRPVLDLSWARLHPWRASLAHLASEAAVADLLARVRRVQAAGSPGPRRLLGGWLADRLALPASALTYEDARHARVELVDGSGMTRLIADRDPHRRTVRAKLLVGDRAICETEVAIPANSLAWSLAYQLTHLRRDELYERALSAAASE
jgi:glucose-6-phosphate dehydrogenase assembly protein OpcA